MTWFRVDDGFYDHPKADSLPDAAVALWTRAGSYCSKHLTDGFIPERRARAMCDVFDAGVTALLTTGLWIRADGGYQFHDWLTYQQSREAVLAERSATAKRQAEWRERKKAAKQAELLEQQSNGDHDAGSNAVSNASRNGPVDPLITVSPSLPFPSYPSKEQNPSPPSGAPTRAPARASDPGPLFDEFWEIYPRKAGKIDAKKAWEKAIKKVNPDRLIACARRFADDPNRDPEFTAYPATWLNGGRWDDEPLPARLGKRDQQARKAVSLVEEMERRDAQEREWQQRREIAGGQG